MKTLLNTYCVIETDEHVKVLSEYESWVSRNYIGVAIAYTEGGGYPHLDAFDPGDLPHLTRVTVEQYIDLLTDIIVPWRLAELGFKPYKGESEFMRWENEAGYTIDVIGETVYVNDASFNINTFFELQIQIRFLTPNP